MATPEEFAERTLVRSVNDRFDGSDAKAVEAEELRRFLDHVTIAIVAFRTSPDDPRIVYVNRAFEALFGRPSEELRGLGWSIWDGLKHEDNEQLGLGQVLLDGDDYVGTFRLEKPQLLLLEAYTTLIEKDDSGQNYRIVALVDVTRRERAQREEFSQRLRDKEMLLLELQHRVKNNLQLVTALIRLEGRSARQGHSVNLEKLAGRIEALRLLYRDISADSAGKTIDLGHYVSEIATALINAYAVDGIGLDLRVDHAPASINVAMPAGLIVNELITNAFKYAFPGRAKGTISVRCLHPASNKYQVMVADDGVGLPEGTAWPVPGKIGALVVQTLRENAETDVKVETKSGQGTSVVISFTHTPPATLPN